MDFYINLGIAVLLQVLRDLKQAQRYFPAIAKVYAKIEKAAQLDEQLQAEIEHQRKKEGL